ncbi:aminoglycoside resistance protein [Comamonas serinivorans]|uniref:Aminoglycoside (3'') (9) adenylyltransferase n=1 Tax=Comamonas serinivorans TaxID=1082851 RepID=A0A1Y0ET74_9BURK|nr:aminoglycoside adenylyltransferase family protein [Comamonas serinivorans]ARU06874.1 aminoglycoside resistance protein [Comamonas serinivorans]
MRAGDVVPAAIAAQLAQARAVIEHHLQPAQVVAIHLFSSALDGGLKPLSDIDLLVTVAARPDEDTRRAVLQALLAVSAPSGQDANRRALEVTVLAREAILPWRHPARRELQFGEWLREDLLAGVVEPAMPDPDLALLLTQARRCSVALVGPPASALFEPVPRADVVRALAETIAQWREPADWAGDERNIVLALARIAFTAETGAIAPKDAAADWLLPRLPVAHQVLLRQARDAYRSGAHFDADAQAMAAFVHFVRHSLAGLLNAP